MQTSVVRFGNLWKSTGSVVELWMAAAKNGHALLLTDPRMTRFVMTLPQACEFIAGALDEMQGGEVFVPHLPRMRLVDLAAAIGGPVQAMGLRSGGEKIHERMLSDDEPHRTIATDLGYVICPNHQTWAIKVWIGDALPDDFRYSSDRGPLLSVADLEKML